MSEVIERDISDERFREYDFQGRVYRIDAPLKIYMRNAPDCTTHRVLDSSGMVHLVPAPGRYGCVIRWEPKNLAYPVQF